MLNSAIADYKSKHLHGKGTPRGGPGSSRIARGGSFRGNSSRGGSLHNAGTSRGRNSSRGNGRGGHQSHFKDRSFNKNYHKNHKSVGFKPSAPQNGAHAANLAMPPSPPYPTAPEQHFAFAANHDEALVVSSVMDVREAEDKQKKTDAQQPKTESIVGMKRHYNEEEGQQPDIYDAYPTKKPRLMDAIDTNNDTDNLGHRSESDSHLLGHRQLRRKGHGSALARVLS